MVKFSSFYQSLDFIYSFIFTGYLYKLYKSLKNYFRFSHYIKTLSAIIEDSKKLDIEEFMYH